MIAIDKRWHLPYILIVPFKRRPQYAVTTGHKLAIKAMYDSGIPRKQIATCERMSEHTIHRILTDPELQELDPYRVEKTKKMLASRFYVLADKGITKASQEDRLEKMNSYQLTMISAVSVDKARLLDGLSTENLAVRTVEDSARNTVTELNDLKTMIIKKAAGFGVVPSDVKPGIVDVVPSPTEK